MTELDKFKAQLISAVKDVASNYGVTVDQIETYSDRIQVWFNASDIIKLDFEKFEKFSHELKNLVNDLGLIYGNWFDGYFELII